MTTATFAIGGMHCASCAARNERALHKIPGVREANVNLGTRSARVEFDDAAVSEAALHEAIVEMLRKEGFSGATVLRGVGGFGGSSVYHTDKLLRMSQDLPIILEVIDTSERIEQILPRLDEMVDGGLITLEKVRVILYRAAKR